MLKVVSWESIRKDRFSLTPQALFDELARNTQFILSSWRGDATRRQERMRAPLEETEDEDDTGTKAEEDVEEDGGGGGAEGAGARARITTEMAFKFLTLLKHNFIGR